MGTNKLSTEATGDYLYLLERGYSQRQALKLVGDRYRLTGVERSMLYRGVVRNADTLSRTEKRIDSIPAGARIYIDGYNVIRTVGSYLLGKNLFVAMDGFLRDASEMHRSTLKKPVLEKSVELLIGFLSGTGPESVAIFLDEPVSKSGELALKLNTMLRESGISGKAETVRSPDHQLKQVGSGIVCTSDSAIIDSSRVPVFDLARAILTSNFNPGFEIIK